MSSASAITDIRDVARMSEAHGLQSPGEVLRAIMITLDPTVNVLANKPRIRKAIFE